jgi:hypothetical protein
VRAHVARAAVVGARVEDALLEGERVLLSWGQVDLCGDGDHWGELTAESGETE